MRKALKLALEPEQISVKNSYPMIDGFEIHLYGDQRDHFELYEMLGLDSKGIAETLTNILKNIQ